MSAERLAAVLDGARHVTYCPDGLVLAWFGGHGLHVYALSGEEVDYRSVGDFSSNDADHREVVAAVLGYLTDDDLTDDDLDVDDLDEDDLDEDEVTDDV